MAQVELLTKWLEVHKNDECRKINLDKADMLKKSGKEFFSEQQEFRTNINYFAEVVVKLYKDEFIPNDFLDLAGAAHSFLSMVAIEKHDVMRFLLETLHNTHGLIDGKSVSQIFMDTVDRIKGLAGTPPFDVVHVSAIYELFFHEDNEHYESILDMSDTSFAEYFAIYLYRLAWHDELEYYKTLDAEDALEKHLKGVENLLLLSGNKKDVAAYIAKERASLKALFDEREESEFLRQEKPFKESNDFFAELAEVKENAKK